MGHACLLLKRVIRAGVWTGAKLAPKNQSCAPGRWACVLFLLMSDVTKVPQMRLSVALMLPGGSRGRPG